MGHTRGPETLHVAVGDAKGDAEIFAGRQSELDSTDDIEVGIQKQVSVYLSMPLQAL